MQIGDLILQELQTLTSSKEALPALSPMPLMVTSSCLAPAQAPYIDTNRCVKRNQVPTPVYNLQLHTAKVFAVESPRSFWQCVEMMTFSIPGVLALMSAINCPNSLGTV